MDLPTVIVSTNLDLNVTVPQIADEIGTFEGPLAGILAAMMWARSQDGKYSEILTIPVDVPHFPPELVGKLIDGNRGHGAIAHDGNRLQPAFGLWPLTEWRTLSYEFKLGTQSLHACGKITGAVTVAFDDPAAFHNINRPQDLVDPA